MVEGRTAGLGFEVDRGRRRPLLTEINAKRCRMAVSSRLDPLTR